MFRKITSQKPDRFPKPVRFKVGNYLSEKPLIRLILFKNL